MRGGRVGERNGGEEKKYKNKKPVLVQSPVK
jgi:hypothetical protein